MDVIAINDNWKWFRNWGGDARRICYGCDPEWWDFNHFDMDDFNGDCWTQDERAAKKWGINHIPSVAKAGLSGRNSGVIHQGSNSGFQALNLAYLWGATEIILLGYDMTSESGAHWFGEHPKGLQRVSPFDCFIKAFNGINAEDVRIINCSPHTALNCFERMTIEEALNAVR